MLNTRSVEEVRNKAWFTLLGAEMAGVGQMWMSGCEARISI